MLYPLRMANHMEKWKIIWKLLYIGNYIGVMYWENFEIMDKKMEATK